MTSKPPQRHRNTDRSVMLVFAAVILICLFVSVSLALVESLTPAEPLTDIFYLMRYGRNEKPPVVVYITPVQDATFTPTLTPIPPTATIVPATWTPTPSPTNTPIPTTPPPTTPPPTATVPPADTPTPPADPPTPIPALSPTSTPTSLAALTPTSTPTPTVNTKATGTVQANATAQALATVAAQATSQAVTPATPKPTNPPPSSLSGRVAFPIFDPGRGTYDVFIAGIDGSNVSRLVTEASQPDLRPDGQVIAFRRWKSDERGIETLDLGSGGVRRFTTYLEDSSPAWSQDGGNIAFFSRREGDRQSRLYRVNINDSGEQELKDGVQPVFGEMPAWQPDGRIAYRANFPNKGIAVANGDGSNSTMIVSDDKATAPSVSPDGKSVAFMSQSDGNWEIYSVNIDGQGLRRLTQVAGNDGLPVWAPDGRTIVFVSDRGGAWSVFAMNPNGSSQRKLFTLPGSIDGRVGGEPDYASRGWVEERISLSP